MLDHVVKNNIINWIVATLISSHTATQNSELRA